ncbi:MAG TPA: DUF2877 domain-containing protein [Caldimonas sp.]|nr:DUF2877 domain-containing protein [Caldimonas sp.]
MAHVVESIGYHVPRTPIVATVHSVFERACNLSWRDTLLTLCHANAAPGPLVLHLAADEPADFRRLLEAGERVEGTGRRLCSERAEFDHAHAIVWRPGAPGPLLAPDRATANLRRARQAVADRLAATGSVIATEGAPWVAALVDACRDLHSDAVGPIVHRLVGWGEGLTPAGDDVLMGFMAALDAPVFDDSSRRIFRDAVRAACIARTARTTPVSAVHLRLAAEGLHGGAALRARDALLGIDDARIVDAALDDALAIGATSGAAMLAGLIGGLDASRASAATRGQPRP